MPKMKKISMILAAVFAALAFSGCSVEQKEMYTLENASGMKVVVTPFGARIVSVFVPDRDGNMQLEYQD